MSITVKYFASLRESLGKSEETLTSDGIVNVADVWSRSTQMPLPANVLVALNMEYVRPDHRVQDGDEVAFFPPVTGGAA